MIDRSSPLISPQIGRGRVGWAARLRANEAMVRIAKNTSWLLGDRLIRAALGFLVGAWVARYLGPDRFGHFAYVLAFVAFFQAVANLGTDTIVVRDVAREPQSAPEILGSILRLRVASGFVCWAAAVGLMALMEPGSGETIAMTAIIGGVLVFQAADTVDLWFQSQTQSRRTVVAKLFAYLLTNGLKIALVLTSAPLIAFAVAFLFDFAGAALALAVAYRRYPTKQRWTLNVDLARTLLTQSWPFMLSALSIIVYVRIDQIMLKQLRGDHELGIYAAALPLSQIWQMIPLTLAMSLAPQIARLKLLGSSAYENALVKTFRLFAASSIVSIFVTCISASYLLPFIYGARYDESIKVLQIHVFTNIFIALGIGQTLWIANERAGRLLLLQTFGGACVAIVGNSLAIPIWGAMGAAYVAVAANATSGLLVNMVMAPRLFRLQIGLFPK